jgi:hypothetical protein
MMSTDMNWMCLALICAANGVKGADVLRKLCEEGQGQDYEHARY